MHRVMLPCRYEWKHLLPLVSLYIDLAVQDFEAESAVEVKPWSCNLAMDTFGGGSDRKNKKSPCDQSFPERHENPST